MTKKQIRVSPETNTSKGWKRRVQQLNNGKDSGHYMSKQEAIKSATQIAKNQGLELKVQNRDGKISQANSFGNDPREIRG